MRRVAAVLAVVLLGAACGDRAPEASADALRPPLSIDELRTRHVTRSLEHAGAIDGGPGFDAHLVRYEVDELALFALVAVPDAEAPADGFPVVIANHGFVPDPRRYGIGRDGRNLRPGDYYRAVPELYTSRGYLVVMPDYRGHNSSDGYEYVNDDVYVSIGYYAEDVVALLSALDDLDLADTSAVHLWSHSMGGPISMRALLATDVVKSASFWSTMNVDGLLSHIADIDVPVIIHHAVDDRATEYRNSQFLAEALRSAGIPHAFHSYPTDEHFFTGRDRELAAERDAVFFASHR